MFFLAILKTFTKKNPDKINIAGAEAFQL